MRRGELIGTIGPDPDGGGRAQAPRDAQHLRPDGQVTKSRDAARSTASPTPTGRPSPRSKRSTSTYDANAGRDHAELSAGGTAYALTQTSYDSARPRRMHRQRMNPAIYGSLPASACTLGTAGQLRPRPDRQDHLRRRRPGDAAAGRGRHRRRGDRGDLHLYEQRQARRP